jgi:serine protease Do
MEQQPEHMVHSEYSRPVSTVHHPAPSKKPISGVRLKALSVAFLILVSASAGFAGGWLGARGDEGATTIEKQQVVLKSQGQLISSIADKVGPSVVSVETTAQTTTLGFFGQRQSAETEGAGTGIVLEEDGLIMTNRHVVPLGTTKVAVVLSDGTRFEDVTVLGRTSAGDTLDVAFLKVRDLKGKKLTPATLGDSGKTNVGDSVIAIGNALGQFQNTVTSGIISGYGRSVTAGDESGYNTETLENLIQTDTAINPGNSGGPLVNLDGQVIGMNTAVAGNAENIGFAIPVNDVKGLVASIKSKGKLERPFLGVVYVPVTADIAAEYNLSTTKGAYIPAADQVGQDSIVDGSAAEKAGLKEGDVIIKVDSETVDEKHSLTSLLGKHQVDETITLTILRGGKERTIDVTLQSAPAQE